MYWLHTENWSQVRFVMLMSCSCDIYKLKTVYEQHFCLFPCQLVLRSTVSAPRRLFLGWFFFFYFTRLLFIKRLNASLTSSDPVKETETGILRKNWGRKLIQVQRRVRTIISCDSYLTQYNPSNQCGSLREIKVDFFFSGVISMQLVAGCVWC